MKKAISIIVVLLLLIGISACASLTPKNIATILNTETTLKVSADGYLIFNGTKTKIKVEDLKGKDGLNGINGVDGKNGVNGTNGLNGVDGKDGLTPFIGTNGNWWIGTMDTNVKANGGTSDFVYKSITLTNTVTGSVQKGPFITGTSINFYELDENFIQTGFSYITRTVDNLGTFSLSKGLRLSSTNIQFVAQGFYFNEVRGEISEVPLTMYLVSDIANKDKVNINLLTTLENERVIYLIENGYTYLEATSKAREEVLNIFSITKPDMIDSQNLDITQVGDDNAILLAISLILQGNNTTSKLSALISGIAQDIEKDGILNNEKLKSQLKINGLTLKTPQIRENLVKFYSDNNVQASVPDFERYITQFNTLNEYALVLLSTVEISKDVKVSGFGDINDQNVLLENVTHNSPFGKDEYGYDGISATVKYNNIRVEITPLFPGTIFFTLSDWRIETTASGYILYGDSITSETRFDVMLIPSSDAALIEEQDLYKIELFEFDTSIPSITKIIKYRGW